MNAFLLLFLIGFGSGIIIFPIFLGIYLLFKRTIERRKIKRLIKQNKFLIPIDTKDYNYNVWQNQKYGNIDINKYKDDLIELNTKIFRKIKIQEDNPFDEKEEYSEEFIQKAKGYLIKARESGYTDELIFLEFKKKNYPDQLINRLFNETKD